MPEIGVFCGCRRSGGVVEALGGVFLSDAVVGQVVCVVSLCVGRIRDVCGGFVRGRSGRLVSNGGGGVVESTPFGDVALRRCVVGGGAMVWVEATISPFAAMYAARWIGAQFVVGLVPAVALNGLLVSGDLLVPDDVVDFTQLPRYTFFAGRGYGFLAQREPFCPLLRGALVAAARSGYPRTFARGMLAAADGQVAVGALGAEADVVGAGVVPMCFLARELELCYAPLCVVGDAAVSGEPVTQVRADVVGALAEVVAGLPGVRGCGCATAMQVYRDRGDVGADWRAWIGDV